MAAGAIGWWQHESRPLSLALTLVLIGKLTWEQLHGALPLSGDMPVVVDAHLYGALGGALAGAALAMPNRAPFSPQRPPPNRYPLLFYELRFRLPRSGFPVRRHACAAGDRRAAGPGDLRGSFRSARVRPVEALTGGTG